MTRLLPSGTTFPLTAAISKIPETMYVQILISREKKMVVKMCDVNTKNAAKWARLDEDWEKGQRKMMGRMFQPNCMT